MNYYEMVKEFHEAFGQPVASEPTVLSKERHELRMALIREEWIETLEAFRDNDREGILDGLCDLMYVAMGYGVEIRTPLVPCSNGLDDNFNILVGEELASVEVGYYAKCSVHDVSYALDCMGDYILSWANSLGFGPSFPKAFAEVHRSNMAKLWKNGDAKEYLDAQPGELPILYFTESTSKPGMFIATRPDGKVMKPPTWDAPNLKQFF